MALDDIKKNMLRFLKKTLIFRKPLNKKILLFDKNSEIFTEYFKKNEFNYLDFSKNINIFILCRILLKFKKINIINYYIEYISVVNPKIIITYIENNIIFYQLKNYFPYVKFIAVQNGIRTKFFFEKLNKFKNLKCDYIFCWGEKVSKKYQENIDCKPIVIGSFKNNKSIKKKIKKRKSIAIIGTRILKKKDILALSKEPKVIVSSKIFHKNDYIVYPIIWKICKKLNFKLEIIGKGKGDIHYEKKFYENIFKSNNFTFHNKKKNIYKISDEVELCVSTTSSFGLESIARGNKTCILETKKKIADLKFLDPFWPEKNNYKFFKTESINYKKIEFIIKRLINCNYKMWKNHACKLDPSLITYDKNNLKFKKVIRLILK